MKLIKLGGKYGSIIGNYAMVDDEDYEELNKWNWYPNKLYVVARVNKKKAQMHRVVMRITESDILIDHIDGNPLNNQKNNLRTATPGQNAANRKTKINSKSKYLGVCSCSNKNGYKWTAYCKSNGVSHTKYCIEEIEAAIEYNKMALKYHGEFARLNIIPNDYTPPKRRIGRRSVIQYDKKGNIIKEWKSVYDVRNYNMAPSNIQNVATKQKGTAYGYIWRFKEYEEIIKIIEDGKE